MRLLAAFFICLFQGLFSAWGATTAGLSLSMAHDARSDALGPGFVAVADNVGAASINPAGLSLLKRPEFSAFYAPYLLDSRMMAFDFAYPKTPLGSLGLGYFGFDAGNFKGRDEQGNLAGDFSSRDRVFSVSWSRPLDLDRLTGLDTLAGIPVGAVVKIFRSQLADQTAQTCAVDLGTLYRLAELPMSIGVSVRNLGPGLRYLSQRESLPVSMTMGAAYHLDKTPVILLAGLSRGIAQRKTDFSLGLETELAGLFILRGSYQMSAAAAGTSAGGLSPVVMGGFGLRVKDYQIDGSIDPTQALGAVGKFTFTLRFGEARIGKDAFPRRSQRQAAESERDGRAARTKAGHWREKEARHADDDYGGAGSVLILP